jgi:hypothetical protein
MNRIDPVPPGGQPPIADTAPAAGPAETAPTTPTAPPAPPTPQIAPEPAGPEPAESRRGDARLDGQVRRLQVEGQLGQQVPTAGTPPAELLRPEALSDHELEVLALGRTDGDRQRLAAAEQSLRQGPSTPAGQTQLHRLEQAREAARARTEVLDHMVGGCDPPLSAAHRTRVSQAMDAFSLDQLRRLDTAGVRFWNDPSSLPPDIARLGYSPRTLDSVARYEPDYRVILTSPENLDRGSAISDMRHELAHAWDDVRNEPRPRSLASMPDAARRREIDRRHAALNRGQFESMSSRHLAPSNLSLGDMYDRFLEHAPRNEQTFANPGTRESIPKRNPVEFYAEGYSVFHGSSQQSQARLLHYAPELYAHLEHESAQLGLPVPDRAALVAITRERGFY